MNTALADIEVESSLREKAENILNEIGMTYSQAINLFTRQVVFHREIPFKLSLPIYEEDSIPFIDNMTDEEFNAYMQKAYDDHKAGRYYSLEEAEKILEEELNEIISR